MSGLFFGFVKGIQDLFIAVWSIKQLNKSIASNVAKENAHQRQPRSKWVNKNAVNNYDFGVRQPLTSTPIRRKPTKTTESLYRPISSMVLVNVVIYMLTIVVLWVIDYLWLISTPFISNYVSKWKIRGFESLCYVLFQLFWRILVMTFIEVFNMVKLREVTMKIQKSDLNIRKSTQEKCPETVGHRVINRIYTTVYMVAFISQMNLFIYLIPIRELNLIISAIHNSIIFSFYSFEYRWTFEDLMFEYRLLRVINCLPYFVGFGLPIGVLQAIFPDLLGIGTLAAVIIYPLTVVGCYRVDWDNVRRSSQIKSPNIRLVFKGLFRPTLFVSNVILKCINKLIYRVVIPKFHD